MGGVRNLGYFTYLVESFELLFGEGKHMLVQYIQIFMKLQRRNDDKLLLGKYEQNS